MEASDSIEITPADVASIPEGVTPEVTDPVAVAAALMLGVRASVSLTAGGGPGAVLPETKFKRLSLTRRVLGFIADEEDETAYGPRNTLAALTRSLMLDPHTFNPQNPEADKLDISGTLEDTIRQVFEQLNLLIEAGLVEGSHPGPYQRTDAGNTELAS
jgi:hypothetical protein